jgi:hypothetical protein
MRDRFSEAAIKLAPWSMSKAGLAHNCGFAFNCQYVKKFVKKTGSSSKAARIGTAVHSVLEDVLVGAPMPAALRKAVVDARLTTNEIDDVTAYVANIRQFQDRLGKFKAQHDIRAVHVEKEFGFDVDMQKTGYMERSDVERANGTYEFRVFFRGKWDLVLETGDGHIIILDHKSGIAPSDDIILARHDKQRRFYALGALVLFPNMVGLKTAFHYVGDERITWVKGVDTPDKIRADFVPWYVDYINTAAELAEANHVGSKDWYCSFCNFTHLCPGRSK